MDAEAVKRLAKAVGCRQDEIADILRKNRLLLMSKPLPGHSVPLDLCSPPLPCPISLGGYCHPNNYPDYSIDSLYALIQATVDSVMMLGDVDHDQKSPSYRYPNPYLVPHVSPV